MCNLYCVTKCQPAIRDLFSVKHDPVGNPVVRVAVVSARQPGETEAEAESWSRSRLLGQIERRNGAEERRAAGRVQLRRGRLHSRWNQRRLQRGDRAGPRGREDINEVIAAFVQADDHTHAHLRLHDSGEVHERAVAANRTVCKDFDRFKPLFERVQKDLDSGLRKTRRFQIDAEIKVGEYFILGGQKAYIAEVGEEFLTEQGRRNARMRVIFDNGTESRGLMRSIQGRGWSPHH